MHELSRKSFSATAIPAAWFSPAFGLSVSGAVINAATSRIRHSSHVVNPPCVRVPNVLSRIPTVKQIEPLLSAIRAVIHKPSRCQSTDTCPSHQMLVSTPNFPPRPPRPVSDASSRDKMQTLCSDGRRCDRSSPRCGVSVKCPQCGLFCEKVVPGELLESVVFEQKDGCTRKSFRVHSNQPVLPQGFVLHSMRDQTSRRHEHVTQTTPAPKTEVQKAQEVKPEPQQCHQTMKGQVRLMFIVLAPKTRSPTLLEQH